MTQWFKNNLAIATSIAVLMLFLALTVPNTLRIILILPFVLVLPGFALTVLLFNREYLGIAERLLLSIGLSVSLWALIAVLLNWTPWGLQRLTLWTAILVLVVPAAAVILISRRRHWVGAITLPAGPLFTTRQWFLMSLAALVTVVAIYVARAPVQQQGFEGYTTFWIQPSRTPDLLSVGVNNDEFETTKYQIRFELNGTLRDGPILELQPGETWEGALQLPADLPANKPVIIYLYRLDRPDEAYRHAVWWPE
jgi:uncharacterized membrane protein